jgi:hypothetical protein
VYGCLSSSRLRREIRLGDDPNATSRFVDDRHPPDLMPLHSRHNIFERRVGGYGDHALRNHIFDEMSGRILACGDRTADDVAIGDHADGAVGRVNDRDLTAVVVDHQLRDFVKRRGDRAARWVRRHHIARKLRHTR